MRWRAAPTDDGVRVKPITTTEVFRPEAHSLAEVEGPARPTDDKRALEQLAELNGLDGLDKQKLLIRRATFDRSGRLTKLYLGLTDVKDISALEGCTELTHLNLSDTKLADLSPLAGHTKLTHLNLHGTKVSD